MTQTLMVQVETRGGEGLKTLAAGFDTVTKSARGTSKAVKELVADLRSLGQKSLTPLQQAMAAGIEKPMSRARVEMVDTGKAANKTGGELLTIGERARRAATGFRDLSQDGLGNMVDMLQIVELGPLGAGIGVVAAGAMVATGALKTMAKGIEIQIQRSEELAAATRELSTDTDDVTVGFTNMILMNRDLTKATKGLDVVVKGAEGAFKLFNSALEHTPSILMAVVFPLGQVMDGLIGIADARAKIEPVLGAIASGFSSLTGPINAATSAARGFMAAITAASDAWASSVLGGRSALGRRFGDTGKAAVRAGYGFFGIDSSEQREAGVAKAEAAGRRAMRTAQGAGGGGGGGGAGPGGVATFTAAGRAAMEVGRTRARQDEMMFGFGASDGADGAGIARAMAAVEAVAQQDSLAKVSSDMRKLGKVAKAIDGTALAEGMMFRDLGRQIGGELVTGFQTLTASVGQFFGAFAAGTSTLGAFGDAMLDLFGNLSSTIGNFFIQTGTGMLLINPVTGAGLIAAGIGLNALGGFLGGKGSGNRGSGSSSGSAGALVGAQTGPSLPRDGGGPTTIIVPVTIGGHQIDPVVAAVDNAVRRGATRHIARR